MTYINPLASAFAQTGQVQRTMSGDKDRQIRRTQALRKNTAAAGEEVEHEVESTDAVILQQEEAHLDQKGKRKKRNPDDPEDTDEQADDGLDIRA